MKTQKRLLFSIAQGRKSTFEGYDLVGWEDNDIQTKRKYDWGKTHKKLMKKKLPLIQSNKKLEMVDNQKIEQQVIKITSHLFCPSRFTPKRATSIRLMDSKNLDEAYFSREKIIRTKHNKPVILPQRLKKQSPKSLQMKQSNKKLILCGQKTQYFSKNIRRSILNPQHFFHSHLFQQLNSLTSPSFYSQSKPSKQTMHQWFNSSKQATWKGVSKQIKFHKRSLSQQLTAN